MVGKFSVQIRRRMGNVPKHRILLRIVEEEDVFDVACINMQFFFSVVYFFCELPKNWLKWIQKTDFLHNIDIVIQRCPFF
jgi:hypothetical protein